MQFGHYSDDTIPKIDYKDNFVNYKVNQYGYRCPKWSPLPEGKKNVVILGCSHTYGVGLEEEEIWTSRLYNLVDKNRFRFWNLGAPGASGDKVVRILYATEKVLFPKLIIVCWPAWHRRERLENHTQDLIGIDEKLKLENDQTDFQNFLKNVFLVEKFAEKVSAKTFHCFAEYDTYKVPNVNVYYKSSLKSCWPEWSVWKNEKEKRIKTDAVSHARDGKHYGVEHHTTFARLLYKQFNSKLK